MSDLRVFDCCGGIDGHDLRCSYPGVRPSCHLCGGELQEKTPKGFGSGAVPKCIARCVDWPASLRGVVLDLRLRLRRLEREA